MSTKLEKVPRRINGKDFIVQETPLSKLKKKHKTPFSTQSWLNDETYELSHKSKL